MIKESKFLEAQLDALLSESVDHAKERARTAFDEDVRSYNGNFVLFGCGNMGCRVLARLRQDGIEPLAFCDNRKGTWGTVVERVRVLSPIDAAAQFGRQAVFIVTIYNHEHSYPDTRRQLADLGCTKIISVIPLRWKYHETFLPYYRDDLPCKVLEQAAVIREAFFLWSDEVSRREFVAQVHWRIHGDYDVLGLPLLGQEYFPIDLFHLVDNEYFVDVGAYDGDTIRKFLAIAGDHFRRIVALEPDPENFNKLNAYVASLPEEIRNKIELRMLAAGAQTGHNRFASGDGTSSALSPRGSIEVEVACLDDLMAADCPTYIKMDIEGAEIDAIKGASQTISDKSPMVAACAYHAQDHLWKIPLLIHTINSNYRFFLRPYMPECWETVCYAVPHEHCAT